MENLALIESFSEFKDEKFIDRVTLMSILEEVFRNTLKKKYGTDDNFDIIINPDKGDLEIWRNRIVVENGDYVKTWWRVFTNTTTPSSISNLLTLLVKSTQRRYTTYVTA